MLPSVVALLIVAVVLTLPLLLLAWVTPAAPPLIEIDRPRWQACGDGKLRFEDEGSGAEASVFLHGFNGQLGQWNAVWAHMQGCGRRLRFDAPGFGGSSWDTSDYGLPAQAQRVVALLDARGLARVTLVGTSMGGSLAVHIAAHYPERVARLALLAPSGYTGALHYPGLFGLLVRPGKLNAGATVIARSRVYRALFPRSRALQALTVTASYGPLWVAALARIRAPTLTVWSRGDTGVSHQTARALRDAIRGSALLWLDADTGHLIPQQRPQLVAALSCALAAGASPEAAVRQLPAGLLRPGEGLAP